MEGKLNHCKEIIRYLRLPEYDVTTVNRDPFVICCSNGCFDMNGQRVDSHGFWTVTNGIHYEPVPQTDPRYQRLAKFVKDIVNAPEDDPSHTYVQALIGLNVSNIRDEKQAVIWHGPGDDGKSTLMKLLAMVRGKELCCHLDPQNFLGKYGASQQSAQQKNKAAAGSLMVFVDDVAAQGRKFDIGALKNAADPVNGCIRSSNGIIPRTWSCVNLTTNEVLPLGVDPGGPQARLNKIVVIPCQRRDGVQKDHSFSSDFLDPQSPLATVAVQYVMDCVKVYHDEYFSQKKPLIDHQPPLIKEYSRIYLAPVMVFAEFLTAKCKIHPDSRMPLHVLMTRWTAYTGTLSCPVELTEKDMLEALSQWMVANGSSPLCKKKERDGGFVLHALYFSL